MGLSSIMLNVILLWMLTIMPFIYKLISFISFKSHLYVTKQLNLNLNLT